MSKDRMLKKGDNVVMHTCGEAAFPKYFGKVWRCKTDEYITGEGKGLYEQRLVFLEGFSGSFATDYLQYIDLELASSDAIKTTEQPSKAAAVEGILTEEELNIVERKLGAMLNAKRIDFEEYEMLADVRLSHKKLIAANAELSFKNQKSEKDFVNLANLIKEIIPFIHNIEALDKFQTVLLEMFEKRAKEILK